MRRSLSSLAATVAPRLRFPAQCRRCQHTHALRKDIPQSAATVVLSEAQLQPQISLIYDAIHKLSVHEALRAFANIKILTPHPSLDAYTALMSVCAHCSDDTAALSVIQAMKRDGLEPDSRAWCYLVVALCRRYQLDAAWAVFRATLMLSHANVDNGEDNDSESLMSSLIALKHMLNITSNHVGEARYRVFVSEAVRALQTAYESMTERENHADEGSKQRANVRLVMEIEMCGIYGRMRSLAGIEELWARLSYQRSDYSLTMKLAWLRGVALAFAKCGNWERSVEVTRQIEAVATSPDSHATTLADNGNQTESVSGVGKSCYINNALYALTESSTIHQSFFSALSLRHTPSTRHLSLQLSYSALLTLSRSLYVSSNRTMKQLELHQKRIRTVLLTMIDHGVSPDSRLLLSLIASAMPVGERIDRQYQSLIERLSQGIPSHFNTQARPLSSTSLSPLRLAHYTYLDYIALHCLSLIGKHSVHPSQQLLELLMDCINVRITGRGDSRLSSVCSVHNEEFYVSQIELLCQLYRNSGVYPPHASLHSLIVSAMKSRGISTAIRIVRLCTTAFHYQCDTATVRLLLPSVVRACASRYTDTDEKVFVLSSLVRMVEHPMVDRDETVYSGLMLAHACVDDSPDRRLYTKSLIQRVMIERSLTLSPSMLLDLLLLLASQPVASIDLSRCVALAKQHWQIVTPQCWSVIEAAEREKHGLVMKEKRGRAGRRGKGNDTNNDNSSAITAESLRNSWLVIERLQMRAGRTNDENEMPDPRENVARKLRIRVGQYIESRQRSSTPVP